MTADTDLPEPVECEFFLLLDENGDYAVCTVDGDVASAGEVLVPGYRAIKFIVTATPPRDTEIEIEVLDAQEGVATASVTP